MICDNLLDDARLIKSPKLVKTDFTMSGRLGQLILDRLKQNPTDQNLYTEIRESMDWIKSLTDERRPKAIILMRKILLDGVDMVEKLKAMRHKS